MGSNLTVLTAESFGFWYEFLIDINKWNTFPITNKSPFLFGVESINLIIVYLWDFETFQFSEKAYENIFNFISENSVRNFTYILKTNTFLSLFLC